MMEFSFEDAGRRAGLVGFDGAESSSLGCLRWSEEERGCPASGSGAAQALIRLTPVLARVEAERAACDREHRDRARVHGLTRDRTHLGRSSPHVNHVNRKGVRVDSGDTICRFAGGVDVLAAGFWDPKITLLLVFWGWDGIAAVVSCLTSAITAACEPRTAARLAARAGRPRGRRQACP